MTRYVALLRGINVGGKNQIRMPALAAAFAGAGYGEVSTYIQSGNVLFSSNARNIATLEKKIESVIDEAFGLPIPVLIRSRDELAEIVATAPEGFGAKPDEMRYDVWFLKHRIDAATLVADLPRLADGIEAVIPGQGVFYAWRLTEQASKTRQHNVLSSPIYKLMSIRNWNTTTKLLALASS